MCMSRTKTGSYYKVHLEKKAHVGPLQWRSMFSKISSEDSGCFRHRAAKLEIGLLKGDKVWLKPKILSLH